MNLNEIMTVLKEIPAQKIEYGTNWVRFRVSNQDTIHYITDKDKIHYNLINRALHINKQVILVR